MGDDEGEADGSGDDGAATATEGEGLSPMETVAETPVEEPDDASGDDGDDAETGEPTATRAARPPRKTVADDDTEEDIRHGPQAAAAENTRSRGREGPHRSCVQVVKEVALATRVLRSPPYLSLARPLLRSHAQHRGAAAASAARSPTAADRKKLKEIAQEIEVPQGAGLIIRTAGSQRTKAEIKRDYEYLQRQWEQIRELTLKSIAPAPSTKRGNLIHRGDPATSTTETSTR